LSQIESGSRSVFEKRSDMVDKDQQSAPHLSPFDAIRHIDEQLGEYWSARELYKILGYTESGTP
jgi:hypothetical protein